MMDHENQSDRLTVLPFADSILLPGLKTEISVKHAFGQKLDQETPNERQKIIGLGLKQNFQQNDLKADDFYHVGVLIKVKQAIRVNRKYQLQIEVLERVQVKDLVVGDRDVTAGYQKLGDIDDIEEKDKADMLKYMKSITRDIGKKISGSEPYLKIIEQFKEINGLMGYVSQFLNISIAEKQELLEMRSQRDKGLKFLDHLIQRRESVKLQIEMSRKFSESSNKHYRQTLLREQMKAIQDELKESDGGKSGKKDYRELIGEAGMPDDVRDVALEELDKLESQSSQSSDAHVIRNYLDLLVALPWKPGEKKDIRLDQARKVLDDQHHGLKKVKDRIIQHLAVLKLKKNLKGSILLLVGPPGTGKTSLGKSIAEALDRKYVRISLGGVRDEAEIRGHRRTYVGALPGRIIQGLKKAGERNPVFVLDEVDKVMPGFSGDPASALLEVFDPEQNNSFSDHYLEVPYDLSEVFFIATANSSESIPKPLLDRMETIQISGYTDNEKFYIGRDHLIQSVLEDHGLTKDQLVFTEEAVNQIIDSYTREAGVRELKRKLATVARVASEKIVDGSVELPYVVTGEMLFELLGPKLVRHDVANANNPPGVSTGLAWTPVGGEVLFIEGTHMPGKGQLNLTGQLGDVMKESAEISLSLIRSRLAPGSTLFKFDEKDIHIHVPSGAVPKDGPSAGVAMFSALASLFTGRVIDGEMAMTGEITLRGMVLPVGGIKEKMLAAHRAGIKKVILPKENEKDLNDIPEEIREALTFVFAETVEDVLHETLGIKLPKPEVLFAASGFKEEKKVR